VTSRAQVRRAVGGRRALECEAQVGREGFGYRFVYHLCFRQVGLPAALAVRGTIGVLLRVEGVLAMPAVRLSFDETLSASGPVDGAAVGSIGVKSDRGQLWPSGSLLEQGLDRQFTSFVMRRD
jgi:hypothetical protein